MEREPFFKLKNGHNSQNNWWILPLIELDLHFMIIYLCIKFESNTPIFTKKKKKKKKKKKILERKPFFKVEKGP